MSRQLVAVATALLFAPSLLFAAGFDCNKASTPTEKTICADSTLSSADSRLSALFALKKQEFGSDPALVSTQRQWLQLRNACGDDAPCLHDAYEKRKEQLEAWGRSPAPQADVVKVAPDPLSDSATANVSASTESAGDSTEPPTAEAPVAEEPPAASMSQSEPSPVAAPDTVPPRKDAPRAAGRNGFEDALIAFMGGAARWASVYGDNNFIQRHIIVLADFPHTVSHPALRGIAFVACALAVAAYSLVALLLLFMLLGVLIMLWAMSQRGMGSGAGVGSTGSSGGRPEVVFDDADMVVLGYQNEGGDNWAVKYKERGGNGTSIMHITSSTVSGTRDGRDFRVYR